MRLVLKELEKKWTLNQAENAAGDDGSETANQSNNQAENSNSNDAGKSEA